MNDTHFPCVICCEIIHNLVIKGFNLVFGGKDGTFAHMLIV